MITTTTSESTSAATIHGSTSPPDSAAAAPANSSGPKNHSMKSGLTIARSIAWKAATNVRSSVARRPGMIASAKMP